MAFKTKRARGVVRYCIDLGLRADYDRAVDEFDEARQAAEGDPRETGSPALRAKAQAVQAARQAMKDEIVEFELEARDRKRWPEFCAEHPPVTDVDKIFGVNLAELDEIIAESIVSVKRSDGSPWLDDEDGHEFDPATDWTAIADEMSNPAYDEFRTLVLDLNARRVGNEIPFSAPASLLILRSERTSKRQSGAGSASSV